MADSGLRNLILLGIVALTFVLPSGCGVEAIHFSYFGYSWYYDVKSYYHTIYWVDVQTTIYFEPFNTTAVAGRLFHPHPVRMKDPQTRTATSFNCSSVLQFLQGQDAIGSSDLPKKPGLAFKMVPDSSAEPVATTRFLDMEDVRIVPSTNTSENTLNSFSVNGRQYVVKRMNSDFIDPNDNHIGIGLASMNSTATFIPPSRMAHDRSDVYLQVWIEHTQTLDIYIADYGERKPLKPFPSTMNMSLLNEYMYIGFSADLEKEVKRVELASRLPWKKRSRISRSFIRSPPEIPIDSIFTLIGSSPEEPIDRNFTSSSPCHTNPAPPRTGEVRMIGIILGIMGVICIGIAFHFFIRTQCPCPNTQPIRIYLAHAGEDKNFTEQLYQDLKSTWNCKLHQIEVFFDRHSMPSGEDFTENIKRELKRSRVGVVIVSREFFERPWPMTELVYLVRSKQSNGSGVRILPLFYKLSVGEVKSMLRAGAWEAMWSENTRHLDAKECRAAVKTLCKQHGVNYAYAERNNDVRYRQDVLNRVAEMCTQMQKERRRRIVEDLWRNSPLHIAHSESIHAPT